MKRIFKHLLFFILLVLLGACSNFFQETIALKSEIEQPASQPFEKVLIIFVGPKNYEYFYQGMLVDMEKAFAGKDIVHEAFFKGMMAYGQKSYLEENALLAERMKKFQPDHIISIKQNDWEIVRNYDVTGMIAHNTVRPSTINSRSHHGEFEVKVTNVAKKQPVWSGILSTKFYNDFGKKAKQDFIHKANKEIMQVLYENGYIRR